VSDRSAALLSNNFIYAAMVIYALAFLAHAVEVAWSVKTPAVLVKKTKLDFSKTERLGRLKSPWLVIHVSAAIISGGVFLLANFIAATYLILDRYEQKGARPIWMQKFPTLESLDNFSYRLIALVFPLWTFSVIAGAIWAEAAWGRYWGWDPKETWAFITWVAYAAYLHARVTIGWRGRKAAWLCLLAGSTFLFNYVYINVWGTGKHTYSGL